MLGGRWAGGLYCGKAGAGSSFPPRETASAKDMFGNGLDIVA